MKELITKTSSQKHWGGSGTRSAENASKVRSILAENLLVILLDHLGLRSLLARAFIRERMLSVEAGQSHPWGKWIGLLGTLLRMKGRTPWVRQSQPTHSKHHRRCFSCLCTELHKWAFRVAIRALSEMVRNIFFGKQTLSTMIMQFP